MVSRPSAPEPHAEITIELDGDLEPEPTPGKPRIPNAALALVTALVLLAAGAVVVFKWAPDRAPVAEEAVRSFLEAVREGDVDTALALIDDDRGSKRFLVPEALDRRWEIVEIAQVDYKDEERDWALVHAEIEAYDGTRLGHRYQVRIDDGDPVLVNPLTSAHHDISLYDMLDVNGYIAASGDDFSVLLLPGLYSLYESRPTTLESNLPPFLALGDRYSELGSERSSELVPGLWPKPSAEGRRLLDQVVSSHLDSCVVRPSLSGCPFAPPPEDERIGVPADATWQIVEYPQVEAMYTPTWDGHEYVPLGEDPGPAFEMFTVQPGSVEVEAVITEADGERRATLSCGIWVDGFYAVFGLDGGVELRWAGEAEGACRTMMEVG